MFRRKDSVSLIVQLTNGLPRLQKPLPLIRSMKLHKDLVDLKPTLEKVVENRVFRPFDVQL